MDSKGRHQCAHWCNQVSGGHLISPWENPWPYGRIRQGCGHGAIWVVAVLVLIEMVTFLRGGIRTHLNARLRWSLARPPA